MVRPHAHAVADAFLGAARTLLELPAAAVVARPRATATTNAAASAAVNAAVNAAASAAANAAAYMHPQMICCDGTTEMTG